MIFSSTNFSKVEKKNYVEEIIFHITIRLEAYQMVKSNKTPTYQH